MINMEEKIEMTDYEIWACKDPEKLQLLAYQQQLEHSKIAAELVCARLRTHYGRQRSPATVEKLIAYYHTVKAKIGHIPCLWQEFLDLMIPRGTKGIYLQFVRVNRLFHAYPELKKGFEMLCPPSYLFLLYSDELRNILNKHVDAYYAEHPDELMANYETSPAVPTQISPAAATQISETVDFMSHAPSSMGDDNAAQGTSRCDASQPTTGLFQPYVEPAAGSSGMSSKVKPSTSGSASGSSKKAVTSGFRIASHSPSTTTFYASASQVPSSSERTKSSSQEFPTVVEPQISKAATATKALPSQSQNNEQPISKNSAEESEPINIAGKKYPRTDHLDDPSIAAIAKYGSYRNLRFFEKVRDALGYQEVYDNFLKCLNLYNEDLLCHSELLECVMPFLGKFPPLLKEFKDILGIPESGEYIEYLSHKYVNRKRADPDLAMEIDYSCEKKDVASYRAIPKMYPEKCSGRTPLCNEVLNDTWVSFPTWSEESTCLPSVKTHYEETMYRIEDEQFELDMAIQSNNYGIQALENIKKIMDNLNDEEKDTFCLDDTLGGYSTVIIRKLLQRIYGERTKDLLEGLKRNPKVVVPIILNRLNIRAKDWLEKKKQFERVWKEQIKKVLPKALDNKGISFKQTDNKNLRVKTLINEIEVLYEEKKHKIRERSFGGHPGPHIIMRLRNKQVFKDAIDLLLPHIQRQPGIYKGDRQGITDIFVNFILEFFGVDYDALNACKRDPKKDVGTVPPQVADDSEDDEVVEKPDDGKCKEKATSAHQKKESFMIKKCAQTHLPYSLFYVNDAWYIFFRMIFIFVNRLALLLKRSDKLEEGKVVNVDIPSTSSASSVSQTAYSIILTKISLLLSGKMESSHFEEEARALLGTDAYLSYTFDKFIQSIVKQMHQLSVEGVPKQCSLLYLEHVREVVRKGITCPWVLSKLEDSYLKKIKKLISDNNCYKIVWQGNEMLLTIELLDPFTDQYEDLVAEQKFSEYVSNFQDPEHSDTEVPIRLPFLKRNVRMSKELWWNQYEKLQKKSEIGRFWDFDFGSKGRRKKKEQKAVKSSWKGKRVKGVPLKGKSKKVNESFQEKDHSLKTSFFRNISAEKVSVLRNIAKKTPALKKTLSKKTSCISTTSVLQASKSALVTEGKFAVDEPIRKVRFQEVPYVSSEDRKEVSSNLETNKRELSPEVQENISSSKKVKFSNDTPTTNVKPEVAIPPAATKAKRRKGRKKKRPIKKVPAPSYQTSVNEPNSNLKHTCASESRNNIEMVESGGNSAKDDQELIPISAVDPNILSETDFIEAKMHEVNINQSTESEMGDTTSESKELPQEITNGLQELSLVESESVCIAPEEQEVAASVEISSLKQDVPVANQETLGVMEDIQVDSQNVSGKKRKGRREMTSLTEPGLHARYEVIDSSELMDDEEYDYICYDIAIQNMILVEDIIMSFEPFNYRPNIAVGSEDFIYRRGAIRRARKSHAKVCKASREKFDLFHKQWCYRYVTQNMLKSYHLWMTRSEKNKFDIDCVTVNDITKPPYAPYTKYFVRYFKKGKQKW